MNTMIPRRIILPALAMVLMLLGIGRAQDFDTKPGVHFDDSKPTDAQKVLVVYKAMSGLQLVIDSRAATILTPIKWQVKVEKSFPREEAMKLMEEKLREQAGIVLTRLDDKRISVTYNDALPIKKPTP